MRGPARRCFGALGLVALLATGALAGCGSDGGDGSGAGDRGDEPTVQRDGDEITIEGEDGSLSLGRAELPDDFPDADVPLPESGTLQAVVAGKPGNRFYSLTYAIDGGDLKAAAGDYRDQLIDDGFRIEESSSAGSSAALFSAFTARGDEWDVIVYGSGAADAGGALQLQVTPHDESTDIRGSGIDEGAETG